VPSNVFFTGCKIHIDLGAWIYLLSKAPPAGFSLVHTERLFSL